MNGYQPVRTRDPYNGGNPQQHPYQNDYSTQVYQPARQRDPYNGAQQAYTGYGGQQSFNGQQGYGGNQNQMGGSATYQGGAYSGPGNPMAGGLNASSFQSSAAAPSGYKSPVYQGPYGSGMSYQAPYNPGAISMDNWQGAINDMKNHQFGDLADPKNSAGQQVWLNGYANPLIQMQQNMYTQAQNQLQWGANFNEQQYLNRNQTALDWGANAREDAGLNYAIQSGQQNFGEGKRQFDVNSAQGQQKLNTDQAAQAALAAYQRGEISVSEAQNRINDARQKSDASIGAGQNANAAFANTTGRTKVNNDYDIAKAQNVLVGQQNKIDSDYKTGLISVQQKDAATAALKEQHDYLLGQGANANSAQANKNTLALGTAANANNAFSNNTDRTKVGNDYAIAIEQNKIDRLYKTGQLSNEQYNAQTARLQQGSEQQQWQSQLAAQQGQFGQNLQLQYDQMKQDAANQRMQAFGHARAPSIAAYNQSWY